MLERILEPEVMDNPSEATSYDAMDHAAPNAAFVDRLFELGIDRPGLVLDLGTGPGDIPILLCQRSAEVEVVAVDLAQSMLDLAVSKVDAAGLGERVELRRMDVKALDLPDNSFDAVVSNTILHHLPDPITMLHEAARVLRPGGLVLIRDLYRPEDRDELDRLVAEHAADCDDDQRRLFAESLHAALTPEEFAELATQAGFGGSEIVVDSDRHMSLQRGYDAA